MIGRTNSGSVEDVTKEVLGASVVLNSGKSFSGLRLKLTSSEKWWKQVRIQVYNYCGGNYTISLYRYGKHSGFGTATRVGYANNESLVYNTDASGDDGYQYYADFYLYSSRNPDNNYPNSFEINAVLT